MTSYCKVTLDLKLWAFLFDACFVLGAIEFILLKIDSSKTNCSELGDRVFE